MFYLKFLMQLLCLHEDLESILSYGNLKRLCYLSSTSMSSTDILLKVCFLGFNFVANLSYNGVIFTVGLTMSCYNMTHDAILSVW